MQGTQKGDSYSFGIVLYEIHVRHGPFGETGLTPMQCLQKVLQPQDHLYPYRPSLQPLETSFDCVREILRECWSERPEERPDFKTIRSKLRPLRKGMKPNIFDNMMAMMEKYANNLEALVDERTDQLQEEKKKTDALLLEMLPRPVAEQLKKGNKVDPENYEQVSIYFSDIVGFTAMSAESTPLQVVDFLNDLYTCFDSIIGHYDVYKVETIGDAYMVVSMKTRVVRYSILRLLVRLEKWGTRDLGKCSNGCAISLVSPKMRHLLLPFKENRKIFLRFIKGNVTIWTYFMLSEK